MGNCPEVEPGVRNRDVAAKAAGFATSDGYRRAAKVVDEGLPALVEMMDEGEVKVSTAAAVELDAVLAAMARLRGMLAP